jgi:ubiquinone/menaquinone biosynthesis C-methylase UbiE
MSIWGRVFAMAYDPVMAGAERSCLRAHRNALVGRAAGSVLEIGGGTGANLPFYSDRVTELVLTEPEEPMARRLESKLSQFPLPARVVRAGAERLPFEDDSFDAAIATLVLCTVADPDRSLAELRRVLKPGGQLLFIEHVRGQQPRLAMWQDRLHGVQVRIGYGCHCNRDTLRSLEQAGFSVVELVRDRIRRAPPIISPLVVGAAVART